MWGVGTRMTGIRKVTTNIGGEHTRVLKLAAVVFLWQAAVGV